MNSPQAENTQKPRRAQLKHLLIDVHFFNLPKIRALGKRFGSAGKLSLVEAYCQMSCATNGVISLDALSCIAEDNEIEIGKINEFLDYCLKNNLIIEELGGYSNSRVIKDQESYGNKLEKDRKRKDSNGKKEETPLIPAAPDFVYDFDIDLDLNKKNGHPPPAPEEKPKFLELAEKALEEATESINRDSLYMTLGRKPMRNFKQIWLTAHELADVLEQFERAGVPIDKRKLYRSAFKVVSDEIQDPGNGGPDRKRSKAYKYLTTFGLTELLKQLKLENDLKRSNAYLEQTS